MEIADYLRTARRHLLVLVGVPVLAAALASYYVLGNPRPHVATINVAAPSLMGSQYGTYQAPVGTAQFPSDFVAMATSPAVLDAVARQTHVSVAELKNGLRVQQVDVSSQVALTYTTQDPSSAGPVAVAVARQTLIDLFGPPVRVALTAVKSANRALHLADRALADFGAKHGRHPKAQKYVTLRADLQAQRAAAATTLTVSHQVLAQAQAQLVAAGVSQLQTPRAVKVSLAHLMVTTVVPAAATGLFLAIVLVALLELVAQQHRQTARTSRRFMVFGSRDKTSVTASVHEPVTSREL